MNRIEILALIDQGKYNLPLPPPAKTVPPRLLIATKPSRCCAAPALIVLSRQGGYISQGCLSCGKSGRVNPSDIPDLDCEGCPNPRSAVVPVLKESDKNYWYECAMCRRTWLIAGIVPAWYEVFEYDGLAAPGDASYV